MEEALKALNALVEGGTIEMYAIGGAVGAAFYIEAVQTEDVDAFVFLPAGVGGLVSLTPIYEALVGLGGVVEGEHVRFGSWPLQILTDANELIAEAIRKAAAVEYASVATRVFRPEYLCAIALQTGRSKDVLRVTMFLEQGAVEMEALNEILGRFGLLERAAALMPAVFGS